jgi:S-(hydroxymethyl)glutathione dehydrogenase/alcohol dehydrogenase
MRAAVLTEVGKPLEILDIAVDDPGPREVLIRTVASGICHSDLHFQEGKYPCACPTVLGHEASGIVEAVGSDVTYVAPGDHVITCVSMACGSCRQCLRGKSHLCSHEGSRGRRAAATQSGRRSTSTSSCPAMRADAGEQPS